MKKILLLITILYLSLTGYSQFRHGNTVTAEDTLIAKDQAILHNTIIEKNIGSAEFESGFLGSGWKLNSDSSSLTLDYLTVRKAMRIYELLISKIRAVNGGLVISSANAKIKSVCINGNEYQIYPQDDEITFYNHDIARCQVFSSPNLRYYQLEVDSLATDNKSFYCHIIDGTDTPEIDDEIVQFGNTQNTARQGLIYITANDDNSPFISVLDNVNSTNYSGKTKVRLGNLGGITTETFGELTGYGLWTENAYLSGIINATSGSNIYTKTELSDTLQTVGDEIRDTIRYLSENTESTFAKYNDSILARITKNKYTTDSNYVDGKLYEITTDISDNYSQILQNASSITSKVSSSTYASDKTARESEIEGIRDSLQDNITTATNNSSSITQYADSLMAAFKTIGIDGYTRIGKTKIDVNGLTIYNGGISIQDNTGTEVFGASATGAITFSGVLSGVTGGFDKLYCRKDATTSAYLQYFSTTGFSLMGASFYADGNITSKDRMTANSHLNASSSFGAKYNAYIVVTGSTLKYYYQPNGSNTSNYYDLSYATLSGGIYSIDLNGVYGHDFGIVMIKNTADYTYRLIGTTGKVVHVLNTNDDHSTWIQLDNSSSWELAGGVAVTLVNAGSNMTPTPTYDKWMITGKYDNQW